MNTNAMYLYKISKESLSPREFVNLQAGDKANISYIEVVPPRLGQNDFGKIRVHYKHPVYK